MLAEILKYPACFSTAHLEKEKIKGKMGKKKKSTTLLHVLTFGFMKFVGNCTKAARFA